MAEKIEKSDAEWREQLTPEQYDVLRRRGTERSFTGPYWNEKKPGVYRCAGCGEELFVSETKFDSGTGWPSFTRPAAEGRVDEHDDRSHGMVRTEVACAMRRSSRARLPRRSAADRPAILHQFRRPPVRGQVQVACRRADRGTERSPPTLVLSKGVREAQGRRLIGCPPTTGERPGECPGAPRAPDTTLPRLLVHPYQVPVAPSGDADRSSKGRRRGLTRAPSRSIFPNSPSKKICTTRLYSLAHLANCVKVLFLDSHGRTRLHGRWASSTDIRPYWPVPREEA